MSAAAVDDLIPYPKHEALMASAQAGVGLTGLRRLGREILNLSAPQMERWLCVNGAPARTAAAFFNRGA